MSVVRWLGPRARVVPPRDGARRGRHATVTAPERRPPGGARPALEGLCAALLDLPPHEARVLANEVTAMSRRLPSHARLALSAGYATTDALSLLHTGSRLHRLDAVQREALVDRLCAGTATADLVDALKVPVLMTHGSLSAGPEMIAAWPSRRVPPDRPPTGPPSPP